MKTLLLRALDCYAFVLPVKGVFTFNQWASNIIVCHDIEEYQHKEIYQVLTCQPGLIQRDPAGDKLIFDDRPVFSSHIAEAIYAIGEDSLMRLKQNFVK